MVVCVFVCVVRAGRQTDNSQIGQVGISHNEPCRGRKVELRAKKKKRKKKDEGQRAREKERESDGDGLRARDKAPKEQLQEIQRRCGPSPQA